MDFKVSASIKEVWQQIEALKSHLSALQEKEREEKNAFVEEMIKEGWIEIHHPYEDLGYGDINEEAWWLVHPDYSKVAEYLNECRFNEPDENIPSLSMPIPEDKYYNLLG